MAFVSAHGPIVLTLCIALTLLVAATRYGIANALAWYALFAICPVAFFITTSWWYDSRQAFPLNAYLTWIVPPFLGVIIGMLIRYYGAERI